MALSKYYTRINWKNRPSTSTPLGETNLNHMDSAVDELDNRIVTLDAEKFKTSDAQKLCNGIDYDPDTGIFVFHYVNGGTKRVDLNIEKIPVNMSLSDEGILTITNTDGTKYTSNIASLLVTVNFVDSAEIDFQVNDSGKTRTVTAVIKNGSITEEKLDSNIQAQIQQQRILAQTAASDSQTYSRDAKRYAVGGVIAADEEDNAKYYYEKSKLQAVAAVNSAESAASSQAGADASRDAAKVSETAAKASETAAKAAELAAETAQSTIQNVCDEAVAVSSDAAKKSETAAKAAEVAAKASEAAAATSELNARSSELAAKASETAAKESESAASGSQTAADASAVSAAASASEAQSWAKKAESVTNIHMANDETPGIVKSNSDDIAVDEDGTMHILTSFSEQDQLTEPTGKESKKEFFGILIKGIQTLIAHIANKNNPHVVTKAQVGLEKVDNTADSEKSVAEAAKATNDENGQNIAGTYIKSFTIAGRTITYMRGDGTTGQLQHTVTVLINNLLTTKEGQAALDAAMGKVLADRCDSLESAINALNSKTNSIWQIINSGTLTELVSAAQSDQKYYISNAYHPDDAPKEFQTHQDYEGYLKINVDQGANRKQVVLIGCYAARGKIWITDSWQGSEIVSKWTLVAGN